MSLKTRILRLEQRQGFRAIVPPIEFFDRIVSGSVTQEEWQRWMPWLMRNNVLPELQGASEDDKGCSCESGGAPDR